jgi:hypothetical protein
MRENIIAYNMFPLFSHSIEKRMWMLMLFVYRARLHSLDLLQSVRPSAIFIMQFHISFAA